MNFLSVPLVYVEIQPLIEESSESECRPELSAAFAKLQLQSLSVRGSLSPGHERLCIQWNDDCGNGGSIASGHLTTCTAAHQDVHESSTGPQSVLPLLYLDQENPLLTNPCPCYCRAYALCLDKARGERQVSITDATMVRILPLSPSCLWKARLTGEWEEARQSAELEAYITRCHSPEAIKQLTMRMKMAMSRPVEVGTTEDALVLHKSHVVRQGSIRAATARYQGRKVSDSAKPPHFKPLAGSLLVHSPDHGSGKTSLVQALARNRLGCSRVHTIRPGPLFAKYGVHADSALETIIHEIALSAAAKNEAVCVILDGLDAMMPPSLSASSGSGDATASVLNGIASYLKTLTLSLSERREIPFPSINLLYNIGKRGWVMTVRICLVAVVTCPDTGWQLPRDSDRPPSSATILNSLRAGRFRLPTLTAETRLSAFRFALEHESVALSPDLLEQLPFLAASAVWAHGRAFRRVAQQLHVMTLNRLATVADLLTALARIGRQTSRGSQVEFLSQQSSDTTTDLFSSVGGNHLAKIALEDALALDPGRRALLESFGLSPPTGILLYGPPGTGKTLLAKAVATLLQSRNPLSSSVGGAFISLSSSDVVRAEVGAGEKLVVAAFETARMNSPSVIFIDEFQALFTERSSGGSSRMTATLLECMDDIRKWADADKKGGNESVLSETSQNRDNRVVVLAATNTPWMVDKAFIRPGRFDRSVHVGLPDDHERAAILRLHIGRMMTRFPSEDKTETLSGVCKRLSMETEGFSGADLAALCRAAAVRGLLDNVDGVDERHLFAAREADVRPSSSAALVRRIELWHP